MSYATLDQDRAQSALGRQAKYPPPGAGSHPFWNDYETTANGLPPLIRSNGLILALATERVRAASRLEEGQIALVADLMDWLGHWSSRYATGWLPQASVNWPNPLPDDEARRKEALAWQQAVAAAADAILGAIIAADCRRYQIIAEEALACLAWLKTLAKAKAAEETRAQQEEERRRKEEEERRRKAAAGEGRGDAGATEAET